jgi:hypothetical protein
LNKDDRKFLRNIYDRLTIIRDEIEALKESEENKYENMPESLRESSRGEDLQSGIDSLTDAYDYIESAVSSLDEVVE